jgi:hypothetical protein
MELRLLPRSRTAALVLLALMSGCDELREKLGMAEPAAPSAGASASTDALAAQLTTTEVAYAAGRQYAMSCVFAKLGEDGEAETAYQLAKTAAARLDVSLPSRADKANALDRMFDKTVRESIEKQQGREVALAYALGSKLTELTFAVGIGADTTEHISLIELLAPRVPVPSSAWKTPLQSARSATNKDSANVLASSFDGYFHYDERPSGAAWTGTGKPAVAREPFAHTSADGRYSATFPFEPHEDAERRDGVVWHKTSTEIDMYAVEWADYPDAAAASAALEVFVEGLRAGGGTHQPITLVGRPAHAITTPIGSSGSMSMRTLVVDARLYKVAAFNKTDAARVVRFLESFTVAGN